VFGSPARQAFTVMPARSPSSKPCKAKSGKGKNHHKRVVCKKK